MRSLCILSIISPALKVGPAIEWEIKKDMMKLERKLEVCEGRSRGISGRMEAREAQCAWHACMHVWCAHLFVSMWKYQRYLHLKGDPFHSS